MTPVRPEPRVVLAEDDPSLRERLHTGLVRHGYGVTSLASGSELLRSLIRTLDSDPHGFVPDVIISEATMPSYGGLEILEALQRAGSIVPVVLLAGAQNEDLSAEARVPGVFAILVKPFEMGTFLAVVDSATSRVTRETGRP